MLYIVATPIGNLSDISLRAIETLKAADFVIAENPSHTAKLLQHYQIPKKEMIQFAEHNEQRMLSRILEKLTSANGALVSDAGTPGISDPGFRLVRGCIEKNIQVTPIPGPSAAITALCASGLPTDSFTFLGFVPKTEIKLIKELEKALEASSTVIFYESPQRIQKTIGYITKTFPNARISVARELTKLHEEFIRGTPEEIVKLLLAKQTIKGEFVVMLAK